MVKFKILSFSFFIFVFGNIVNAQDKSVPKEDKTIPKDLLVPSSGEILMALKKAGDIKWGSLVTYDKTSNYKGRKKQSLNLGVRVADAFIAIFDEDKSNFGYMNNVIFSISKTLSIDNVIKSHYDKISKLSAKNDWLHLTLQLDQMIIALQEEMTAKGDGDIVLLSSIGGFFEGINVVSHYISDNYDVKKVNILNQSYLVDYFINQLDKNNSLKSNKDVAIVYNGLIDLQNLYKADKELSQSTVKKINTECKNIINSIIKI